MNPSPTAFCAWHTLPGCPGLAVRLRVLWPLLLLIPVLGFGCASNKPPPLRLTGNLMVDGPNAIANGPEKDRVLWQYRTAAACMRQGQYDQAAPLLDDALARIEGVFGKDDQAKKSRRMFSAEAKKTFIGEPYERAMAYYYRGILYWMHGEPDNARACFRSGQVHDSDTVDKKYAGDYVLMDYLDGLATAKLGGDGSDAYQRAEASLKGKGGGMQPVNPKANVLFFIEFGPGPAKYATGEYSQELRFRNNKSPVYSATIRLEGQEVRLGPYDDLFYQASTRGGRVMDHILGNQAVFKKTTSVVGDAALISGAAVLASSDKHQEVGAGLLLAGLAAKVLSAATTPAADTRSWDNLPLYLSFAAMEVPPGAHTATVEFRNELGQVLPNLTKTVNLNVPATTDAHDLVLFVSDQSITPQSL